MEQTNKGGHYDTAGDVLYIELDYNYWNLKYEEETSLPKVQKMRGNLRIERLNG
jgi:hypothetical protein